MFESLGGSFGGLSRDRSRFPFPDDPLPATLYGSSSGIGILGLFRMSMADLGLLLTVTTDRNIFIGRNTLDTYAGSHNARWHSLMFAGKVRKYLNESPLGCSTLG